jgi:hypothetical protein
VSPRCRECGTNEDDLSVPDALATLKTLPRRYREALDAPEQSLRRRPSPDTWSMLEYATHVREVLDMLGVALPEVLETARPEFPDFDVDEANASRPAQDREPVLDGISRAANALVDRADATPWAAWDRPFVLGGVEHPARWLVQHAAHEGAHHLRDVTRVREAVSPRSSR